MTKLIDSLTQSRRKAGRIAKAVSSIAVLWLCAAAFFCQIARAQSPDLNLPNTTHSSGTHAYQAANSITAQNGFIVNGSASVTFTAGQTIILKPGFQATAGSAAVTFRANIGSGGGGPSTRTEYIYINGRVMAIEK